MLLVPRGEVDQVDLAAATFYSDDGAMENKVLHECQHAKVMAPSELNAPCLHPNQLPQ